MITDFRLKEQLPNIIIPKGVRILLSYGKIDCSLPSKLRTSPVRKLTTKATTISLFPWLIEYARTDSKPK